MLEGSDLAFRYGQANPWLFTDFSLRLSPGEIVGMPGPSGRGKSTLAKVLAGYLGPARGCVGIDGQPLPETGHCPVQLLFQHPELAVNPRWRIKDILHEAEPPAPALLRDLGVLPAWLDRYPHELSGGELQRVCLVRALAANSRYLLCDEMTAMLDAISQAQVWRIVLEIVRERNLGILVISHDTFLLGRLCDRMLNCFTEHVDQGGMKDQQRNNT